MDRPWIFIARSTRGNGEVDGIFVFLLSIFFTLSHVYSMEFKIRSNCELDFFFLIQAQYYHATIFYKDSINISIIDRRIQ